VKKLTEAKQTIEKAVFAILDDLTDPDKETVIMSLDRSMSDAPKHDPVTMAWTCRIAQEVRGMKRLTEAQKRAVELLKTGEGIARIKLDTGIGWYCIDKDGNTQDINGNTIKALEHRGIIGVEPYYQAWLEQDAEREAMEREIKTGEQILRERGIKLDWRKS
jgi:hypothetical protein